MARRAINDFGEFPDGWMIFQHEGGIGHPFGQSSAEAMGKAYCDLSRFRHDARATDPSTLRAPSGLLESLHAMVMTADQFKTDLIALLPRLRRFAMSLTRSAQDADDLLQDACAVALQKWQQYDPTQPLERWMFRVVRNLWISELRKRKVRQGQGQVPAEEATELRVDNPADDALAAKELRGKVDGLPVELSQPLLLVCAEGYSYKETSELLGIPIGTVMSRIHRARKLLALSLSETEMVAK